MLSIFLTFNTIFIRPAKRGGKECEADDGAINKTDCISKETSNNLLSNLLLGITNFLS